MIIKIAELGKLTKEVAIEGNYANVDTVERASGLTIANATINGVEVTYDTVIRDGAIILNNLRKIKGNNDFIEVKFVKFGSADGGINTVAVAPGSTIADAIIASGQDYATSDLRVGNDATASDVSRKLYNSTNIFLTKKIKGNNDFIEVKFVKFGSADGGINTVAVAPGSTIADAIAASGQDYATSDLRVGNDATASDTSRKLYASTNIFLTKKIKGNN